jgi:hypothetical protein
MACWRLGIIGNSGDPEPSFKEERRLTSDNKTRATEATQEVEWWHSTDERM